MAEQPQGCFSDYCDRSSTRGAINREERNATRLNITPVCILNDRLQNANVPRKETVTKNNETKNKENQQA